jgi:WD40 repeat protein
MLASVGPGTGVWFWDLPTGQGEERGSLVNNQAVHFLPRRKDLLLSTPWGHWITTLHGTRVRRLAETSAFAALPSSDGQFVALVGVNGVELVDPRSEETSYGTLDGHVRPIRCAALSRNGRLLATGSEDRTVIVWDLRLLQERTTFRGFRGPISALAFSPDGRRLAVGFRERESFSGRRNETRDVVLWDVGTSKIVPLEDLSESVWGLNYSPDGSTLALAAGDVPATASPSGPGCLLLYDANTGRRRASLEWHASAVLCVAFAPDGEWLATGGADGQIRLWPWRQLIAR